MPSDEIKLPEVLYYWYLKRLGNYFEGNEFHTFEQIVERAANVSARLAVIYSVPVSLPPDFSFAFINSKPSVQAEVD